MASVSKNMSHTTTSTNLGNATTTATCIGGAHKKGTTRPNRTTTFRMYLLALVVLLASTFMGFFDSMYLSGTTTTKTMKSLGSTTNNTSSATAPQHQQQQQQEEYNNQYQYHISHNNPAYQLIQQYKLWHSEDTLQREFETLQGPSPERKFAVGYYSCPLQAGNRIGAFIESFLWAMLTNRTLLWKYYSQEECDARKEVRSRVCDNANTEAECAKILQRADFLPSYDKWQALFRLPANPTKLRHYTVIPLLDGPPPKKDNRFWYKDALQDNGLADTIQDTVVVFPLVYFETLYGWKNKASFQAVLHTQEARFRARQLRQVPTHYVYGLVLYECFAIQPQYQVPRPQQHFLTAAGNTDGTTSRREGITIIVHSRHVITTNEGSKIKHEKKALETILRDSGSEPYFCQVLPLSDRNATLYKIREYVQSRYPHCFVGWASHDEGISFESEHGPFAGAGFYQDLSFLHNQIQYVPTTRTVFVGGHRSSGRLVTSTILHAMFQQQQQQESYRQQDDSGSDNDHKNQLKMPQLEFVTLPGFRDKR